MLKNYLMIALCHVLAQKTHSAINVAGLAAGLACCLLMALFVAHELSYDRQFPDADRIYRISFEDFPSGTNPGRRMAANVQPAAARLKQDFSEIEQVGRIWGSGALLRREDIVFDEPQLRWADSGFLQLFRLEWLRGDPRHALAEPFSIVLTESIARKYFSAEDPMGQTLLLENKWPLKVTGVIRDLPRNTHLSASALASEDSGFAMLGYDYPNNWSFAYFHTYAKLRPGATIESIASRFPDFIERHMGQGKSASSGMVAQRLTDIHLRSNRLGELSRPGSMTLVYTFSAIALCILLIACINFMNLSTARASQRAREVGLRKVVGGTRGQLIAQFMGESILFALAAMLVAVALAELLLPAFSAFVDRELAFNYTREPVIVIGLIGFAVLAGLLAGSYPALYLSAFQPARVLKGDLTRGVAGARFRSVLVVAQFSISIALVIATVIIYRQMQFARDIELGFRTDNIVVLSGSPTRGLSPQWETLRNELLRHPEITYVTAGSMTSGGGAGWRARAEGGPPEGMEFYLKRADYGLLELHELQLLSGRTFSAEYGTDRFALPGAANKHGGGNFILSELAVRQLGWTPEEAIGKWFEIDFSRDFTQTARGTIIGVVQDAHVESLREPLRPVAYVVPPEVWGTSPAHWEASVRLSGQNLQQTLQFIDAKWRELMPEQPLNRRFLSDVIEAQYATENRQAQMLAAFSSLAIFIACLGLIGLASHATEQRIKEIGVRKVMGGSVWDIVRLFTTRFSHLVLLANFVAWPVAYFFMRRWLDGFAYRTELSLTVFVASGLLALLIAWLTVAVIAARAAGARPVHALRYE